jgi:hypothetical protein
MGFLEQAILDQFRTWEFPGRGGLPYAEIPVCPEPPFRPFPGYFPPKATPAIDDGRRHTVVSGFLSAISEPEPPPEVDEEEEDTEDFSFEFLERSPLVEVQAHLPRNFEVSTTSAGHLFLSLIGCEEPLSFEIFGTREGIHVQIAGSKADANLVQSQATSWFPEAFFSTETDNLETAWSNQASSHAAVVECQLSIPFHFPFETRRVDPLIGIMGALSELDLGEIALFQVLFQPVSHPWAESLLNTVLVPGGEPFFADGEHLVRMVREKVSRPLYGVTLRVATKTESPDRNESLLDTLLASLGVVSRAGGNELIPYFDSDPTITVEDVFLRQSRRFGMILNLDELVTLAHFPSTTYAPKLVHGTLRTKAPPVEALGDHGLIIGQNQHRGKTRDVRLTPEHRFRHTHIIGASGTGKSNLMVNLIRQDVDTGQGLAVLDPHGDLIDNILASIPSHRVEDVILFDPSDEEFPIGFNILSAHSELEKTLLASDLCSVFRRLATSWGDQMTAVLSNAIIAFLESSQGGTLADLRRFLAEKPFRKEFLGTVEDSEIVYFWEHEYPLLSGRPEGSVVTRLNSFLRPKPLRYMVSQRGNKLDLSRIMDEDKILLARIPHGLIGEENAYLLGSLLVAKIHQLVMGRQNRGIESRRPFWLYIDEFHHFITSSMASILSGARKYNLGLTLAHQDLRQLEGRDRDVAGAVISNANTRFCFRLGDQDARQLESGFSDFDRNDLQSLAIGQAVCRIGGAENDFNLSIPYQEIEVGPDQKTVIDSIREKSRRLYAKPRTEVESEIARQRPSVAPPAKPDKPEGEPPATPPPAEPANTPASPEKPPQPETPESTDIPSETTPSPGRGGSEHKALQASIKQIAEGFNFRASVEKPVLDGQGYVDLVLERGSRRIGVEIAITTPIDHEMQNLRKCLDAGFDPVVMLAPDQDRLRQLEEAAGSIFHPSELERIRFSQPDDIAEILQFFVSEDPAPESIMHKGYKVKATFKDMGDTETQSRKRSIQKTIAAALRKQREK